HITSNTCVNWTSALSGNSGTYVQPDGGMSSGGSCNVARSLACCNGAPQVAFAGFTAASAPMSGRPTMHAACGAQFPGAHMCHAAEYIRCASASPIPAAGAWLDPSVDETNGFISTGGSPAFGRH